MGNTGLAVAKAVAKVICVGLENSYQSILQDCFKQFGIQVVPADGDAATLLNRQKFEACVLRLYDKNAETVLAAARNSSSNRRMVMYGIARNVQEALRFSSYGINAVFDEPLDRSNALKVVRSTHLLVIHELRRYVRIPLVTEIFLDAGSPNKLQAATQEVSAGGMSIQSATVISSSDPVKLSFTLPGAKKITIRATSCWARPHENLYGFRFDTDDPARQQVRKWIDQYLEIM